MFPEQQYFGKLHYMVNHARLGYKIRAKPLTFSSFVNLHRNPKNMNINTNKIKI